MNDNPLDKLSQLAQRLGEEGTKLGLHLDGFAIIPGAIDPTTGQHHPHMAQAVFRIDPEQVGKTDEDRQVDEQFRDIMLRAKVDEDADKKEKATDNLKQMIEDLSDEKRGILGDE